MAVCERGVGSLEFLDDRAASGVSGFIKQLVSGMVQGDSLGSVKDDHNDKVRLNGIDASSRGYRVPCKPLGDILHESNITRIDFFSLDVEGSELRVLRTMDGAVPVCVWLIETNQMETTDQ